LLHIISTLNHSKITSTMTTFTEV